MTVSQSLRFSATDFRARPPTSASRKRKRRTSTTFEPLDDQHFQNDQQTHQGVIAELLETLITINLLCAVAEWWQHSKWELRTVEQQHRLASRGLCLGMTKCVLHFALPKHCVALCCDSQNH